VVRMRRGGTHRVPQRDRAAACARSRGESSSGQSASQADAQIMGLLFPIGTKSRPCRSLCGIAGGNVLNPERGVLSLDVQEHDQAVLDRGKARTGASAMKWEHKVEFFVLGPAFHARCRSKRQPRPVNHFRNVALSIACSHVSVGDLVRTISCSLSVTSSVHKRGHSNAIAEWQRRPARPLG
jgi:hypothetical protein